MKKIALFSLLVCMGIVDAGFAGTCGPAVVGFDGKQSYADDEFLYENEDQFEKAKYGYQNSGGQNSGSGRAWECDTTNSGGCVGGDKTMLMPAGHYFEGKRVDVSKVYRCENHVVNDVWVEVSQDKKKCTTSWGDLDVGMRFQRRRTTAECSGMELTEAETLGVEWAVECVEENHVVCKPTKCIDGYNANIQTGKCDKICPECDKVDECETWKNNTVLYECCQKARLDVSDVTFNNGICECKDKETRKWNPKTGKCEDTQKTKTCKESRTTAEGKACCDLPESEAKWDGKNCKCLDANATFKIDANGRGKCETNQSPVDNTPGNCWYMFRADMQCANGNSYVGEKKYLLTESDLNGQTCETFLKLYQNDATKMLELFNKFCNSQGSLQVINITPVGPNAAEVSNAKGSLDKFFANAESEASVWKDSEGKFNTARLASDLTAGVVLGTVGGVVSGVVIKKKQVEKGFEVLHCAVGGQKIADWGDEFSVGLQR